LRQHQPHPDRPCLPMEQQQPGMTQRTQSPTRSPPPPLQQPQQQQQAQQLQPDAVPGAADPSRIWLPEVVHHFARFLGGNELAATLRLVNKATAAQFRGRQHTTIRLSLPVPHHAFVWRWGGLNATRSLTVRQRKQLPCLTARSGSISNLEVLLPRDDLTSPLSDAVLEAAAGAGQLEACRWLRQLGCPLDDALPMWKAAARGGHRAVCEWLVDEDDRPPEDVWVFSAAAARGGHVDLMDWLLERTAGAQGFCVPYVLAAAAAGCGLLTLQRLHHTYLDSRGEELPDYIQELLVAAAAGSPTADWRDKVEWLEGRGCPRTGPACRVAAKRVDGRERLEWLQQRGYPLTAAGAYQAATHGNADALEFLLAQGVELGEELAGHATYQATSSGHLAALKVLHAHGARFNGSTVATAAEAGHLPAVAWLVETLGATVALTADLFVRAAESGNAGLLAWLHEHSCPKSASVFAAAAAFGSEEQLEWLAGHGCPMGQQDQQQQQQQPDSVPGVSIDDPSRVWLPEVVHHFAGFLGGNELAATLPLVNKAAAAQFHGPQHTTIRLSLLVPHHAFVWRWGGPNATRTLTVQQRKQLPCLTARSGSISNLDVLLARVPWPVLRWRPLPLEVCRWLQLQDGILDDTSTLQLAAAGGHRAVCEWLIDEGDRPADVWAASAAAARGGHVGLMDWLLERTADAQGSDVANLLAAAAAGCDLPTLQRLHHTYLDSRGGQLPEAEQDEVVAAADGTPTADWRDKVEWLEGRGYPRADSACRKAAQRVDGRERLECLQQRGYPLTIGVVCQASAHGNADALEFLMAQGVGLLDEEVALNATFHAAAEGGHLATVKVLHAHGARIHVQNIAVAALAGHLRAVAWLVETLGAAVVLIPGVFARAAMSGNAELLAWLHQHGCPWDASVFAAAAAFGSEEQLEWLAEHGCPIGLGGKLVQHHRHLGRAGFQSRSSVLLLLRLDGMTDLQASAPAPEAARAPDAAALWHHLPPELLLRVLACLPPNERACTARLICKAAAAALSSPQHTTVRLSQPSPHSEFVRRWGGPGAMRPLILARRRMLLSLTAASGCLGSLQWLAAHAGCSLTGEVFEAAAAAGRLDACRWLQQQGCYMRWALSGAEAATGAGQRATVEWLLANPGKQDGTGLDGAACRTSLACSSARGGHVGLMDWLLQRHGLGHDGRAAANLLAAAAEGCDMPTLQRLYHAYPPQADAGGGPVRLDPVVTSAAGSPTPDWKAKVEWLEGQGAAASSSHDACARAASRPDALDRLTWLRGRGYPWDKRVTEAAAVAGNLDALRYLLAEGCPVAEGTLGAAAWAGQLASLQALHAHSSTFIGWGLALARAASEGHLPVVAWVLEQQLVSIAYLQQCLPLLPEAATSGSVELLAWLRNRGCPWGEGNFYCAAEAGSEEALEWLVAQGCPMQGPREWGDDPYVAAARQGDWSTLACLHRLGCPWQPLNRDGGTFLNAVQAGCSVPALRRLLELGCPVGWRRAVEAAARRGDEGLDGMTDVQASASVSQAAPAPTTAAPWHHLPPELLLRVLACLPPNELACTARLVCKATAIALSGPQHTTVRLSQPSPPGEFVRRWGSPGAMRPLTLVRRRLLLSLTAASGCLENLQWLAAHVGCSLTGEVFEAAAAAGRLDVCRWLHQQDCDGQEWVLGGARAAAGAGQRAVVEWLLANPGKQDGTDLDGAASHTSLACSAAGGGHVGLMDWLLQRHGLERGRRAAATLLEAAAEGCDLPTLQRLYHTYSSLVAAGGWSGRLGSVLNSAARSPTPDWKAKVEWLEGQGAAANPSHGACAWAASRPDALNRLTWLRGRGYPWDWQATNSAAAAGNLDALRYLLAEGCPVQGDTLVPAARAGQLASLQTLHAHNSIFTVWDFAFVCAARGGHMPVVAWLLEQQLVSIAYLQQCHYLLSEAAQSGSVELMAWLRDRGCLWREDNFFCAAETGSEEALEWLVAQGCPMPGPGGRDDDPYLTAAREGDWGMLACLRRLGCPWRPLDREGGTFVTAVAQGCSVPTLRRLLELGCPVDLRSAIEAGAIEAAAVGDNTAADDAAAVWHHLPPELLPHILRCLPPNELVCVARLVCKATAAALSSPQHTTISMSRPSPPAEFVRRWGGPGAMRPLTLVRRRQLLTLTAASGCLENLQWLEAHVGCSLTREVFQAAAAAGRLDVCRWLQQQGCYGQGWALSGATAAAGAGQQATVEWLLANARDSCGRTCLNPAACRTLAFSAARGGHVGLMDRLLQRQRLGRDVGAAATLLVAAAEGCDLPTLQRLYHTYPPVAAGGGPGLRGPVLTSAAGSPTPDWKAKVEWLEGQGADASPSYDACAKAASRPDALGRLTWLRGRGYSWSWQAAKAAAVAGNLDALRYLLADGCRVEARTGGPEAGAGQLAALQTLHARSSTFTLLLKSTLVGAVQGGHLPVVAWLLEQQLVSLQQCLPLLPEAAGSGSVELLAWLRDRGSPWGEDSFHCAAGAGNQEALEWLVAQGCPMQEPDGHGGDPYLRPGLRGDWSTLACLRRLGCPWRPLNREGGTFLNAVQAGCSVPALRRLLDLGCPLEWQSAIEAAARRGDEGLDGMTDLQASAPAPEAAPAPGAAALWHRLPPELLLRVLACLPPNERACTARRVCKATAAALSSPQHTTVRLSQPSPHGEFVRRWGRPGAMRSLTLVRRRLLLSLTAASGCLENLQWLAAHVGCSPTREVFEAAAAAGRLDACRWLQQQGCYMQWWALSGAEAAAGAGQRATVEWLLACAQDSGHKEDDLNSVADSTSLACSAARGGHVGTMDWLLQRRGLERDGDAAATVLVAAAEGCDLPTLQRLYHAYPQAAAGGWPARLGTVLTSAAGSPTPDWKAKVEWLEGLGAAARSSPEACAKAASRPDALDRLTWLRGRGYPWDWRATDAVAVAGNLDALRYLLAEGCPVQESTGWAVAEARQLASLQALHAHSNTFTRWNSALAGAVRGGHLPVVAWLLEQQLVSLRQCPSLLCKAAKSGSVELLAWLRDRGCPWGDDSFHCAVGAGSEEALEWLVAQGCPMPVGGQVAAWFGWSACCRAGLHEPRGPDDDLYLKPACNEDWNTLACLRRLGCPWLLLNREGGTFVNALLELGCPVDWRRAIEEAEYGNEGVRAWLQQEQCRRGRGAGPQWRRAARCGAAGLLYARPALAAGAGLPAKVEWLEGLGAAASSALNACTRAASRPDALDRLTWLRGRGYPWDWQATNSAAVAGNLNALRYLLVEGCPSAVSTLGAAAGAGQLASLRALHAHSGNFTLTIFALARTVRGGHLPVVAWLLEQQLVSLQQCPSLLCEAAASGSMELLAWLRDRGCPWGEDTIYGAAGAGSEEALEWLVAQGCPVTVGGQVAAWLRLVWALVISRLEPRGPDDDPYLMAAVQGDWATLACLRRLGWPWGLLTRGGGTFANAVANGCSVPALRRLLELGCPVEWRSAIETAVAIEDKDVLSWLEEEQRRRCRGDGPQR
ncbi:Ankyrin repeat domain-containing protein, partial [Tetrabaena socialis]